MSEALRPSWKLAAGRLPWAWGWRWEERARGAPADSKAPLSAPEASGLEISPRTPCDNVAGLDEDFKQLSEEAPSEGLTTIPKKQEVKVRLSVCAQTCALCVCVRHTNMEGCTGGNGWRPQPECVCGRWWWEEEGDQRLVLPPPPPGPSVAPPQ